MQEAKTRHQILREKYEPLIDDMVKSLSDPARTEYLRLKREVQPLMNQHLSTLKELRLAEKTPHKYEPSFWLWGTMSIIAIATYYVEIKFLYLLLVFGVCWMMGKYWTAYDNEKRYLTLMDKVESEVSELLALGINDFQDYISRELECSLFGEEPPYQSKYDETGELTAAYIKHALEVTKLWISRELMLIKAVTSGETWLWEYGDLDKTDPS